MTRAGAQQIMTIDVVGNIGGAVLALLLTCALPDAAQLRGRESGGGVTVRPLLVLTVAAASCSYDTGRSTPQPRDHSAGAAEGVAPTQIAPGLHRFLLDYERPRSEQRIWLTVKDATRVSVLVAESGGVNEFSQDVPSHTGTVIVTVGSGTVHIQATS